MQLLSDIALPYEENKLSKVAPETARAFIAALSNGLAPTVSAAASHPEAQVRVQLSPVNFKQYYADYLACQAALLPVNFGQIERNSLLFASGSERLSKTVKKQLDNIIVYVKADDSITGLFIEGHSDSDGSRYSNRRLSERRSQKVYDYLVKKGLNSALLNSDYHGERYPIASNATKAGKQANRRVTVRVERQEEF